MSLGQANLVQTYVSQKSLRRRNNGRTIVGLFQGALDQGPGAVKGRPLKYIHAENRDHPEARFQVRRPGSYETGPKLQGKPGANHGMPGPHPDQEYYKPSHSEGFFPFYSDSRLSRRYRYNPHQATKTLGKMHFQPNPKSPNNTQGSLRNMPGGVRRSGNLHFDRSGEYTRESMGSVGLDRNKPDRLEQISTRRLRIRRKNFK